MTTQYTTILKLALPVQGELSGTWGDVVNDNITQMVEQAIAGKATINSWTANAHTLTTADGTTSESRCAILELTDTGTALTGAGTVTCPTNTKLYIVDNNTAEIITVQTAAGTGVAVPVGKTMLVYCDGTNVVEGVTHANSLSLGTSTVTVDSVLDQDDMSSDSATALATQQSIKAYVDSQVGTVDTLAEILANGNTTGANDIEVDTTQKVQFRDTAIYINSSVDGQLDIVADTEIQIAATTVDLNGNLDVSGTALVAGVLTTTAATVFNGGFASNADSTLGTDKKVQFRDTAIYLNSSVDGQLDIVADGEVQIDTALVDINGNLDVSGTTNISGSTTFTKNAIAGVAISTTSRASNTVTVTTSAVHGLTSGDLVNINGVADTSFNGYFTVSVSSTTVFTYSQTGADGSSTGGTSTEVVYNLNASGTALNWMNGPLNIAANSGIDGLEITQSGSGEALSITGGNAIFGDNDKAVFGAGSDLQIYHDASDSIINDNGTGSLKLQQGGSTKLEVTTTGIDITGNATFPDNGKAIFGAGSDLEIYHDGSNSIIGEVGTGNLQLRAGGEAMFLSADGNEYLARFNDDSDVKLYYDNALKLATTTTGVDVTGNVSATTFNNISSKAFGSNSIMIGDSTTGTISGANSNVGVGIDVFEALTTGDSNTAVGKSSLQALTEGTGNTAIGTVSLDAITTQSWNTAVGYATLSNNTASNNTAVGASVLIANTTASNNTAVGYQSLFTNTEGGSNSAFGVGALYANTTASNNTAVGYAALNGVTTGSNNIGIGFEAGNKITTPTGNIAIGIRAVGYNGAEVTGNQNVGIGDNALYNVTGGGSNIALGGAALNSTTTGTLNTAAGYLSGYSNVSGTNNSYYGGYSGYYQLGSQNVAIGYGALLGASGGSSTGTNNTALGRDAAAASTTASNNTVVGYQSLFTNTTGVQNTTVGAGAGYSYTGNYSVIIGQSAGQNSTTGGSLVLIGQGAGVNKTTGNYSIHIGESAGFGATAATDNTGANNISIGGISQYQLTSGFENVAVGHQAQRFMTSGSHNVGIGPSALYNNTTGTYNTVVGSAAGLSISSGIQNTLIGGLAGDALQDADYNVAVGYLALSADTLGSRSVAMGVGALGTQNFTSATNAYNVAIGHSAGNQITIGTNNTIIGGDAGDALITGGRNVALGYEALTSDDVGSRSIAVGAGALFSQNYASATDSHNIAIGDLAGFYNVTGTNNTFVGSAAGLGVSGNSHSNNVGIGKSALGSITTADNNTAVGYAAGNSNTTGVNNTIIGRTAGYTNSTGNNNTYLGYATGEASTGSENTFIGNVAGLEMTTGSKNTILGRYNGNQGGLDLRTSSNNIVLSDGDGNIGFYVFNNTNVHVPLIYSDTTASAANVHIASDGRLYRSTSSARYKNTINDAPFGLAEAMALRPVTYKGNNDGDTVFGGLIAEEVHDAGLTEFVQYNADGEPDSLAYGNMVSLCIKAIQDQQAIIDSLTARIEALESN